MASLSRVLVIVGAIHQQVCCNLSKRNIKRQIIFGSMANNFSLPFGIKSTTKFPKSLETSSVSSNRTSMRLFFWWNLVSFLFLVKKQNIKLIKTLHSFFNTILPLAWCWRIRRRQSHVPKCVDLFWRKKHDCISFVSFYSFKWKLLRCQTRRCFCLLPRMIQRSQSRCPIGSVCFRQTDL